MDMLASNYASVGVEEIEKEVVFIDCSFYEMG